MTETASVGCRPFEIRSASPEELDDLFAFVARFEQPGLPPYTQNLDFLRAMVLVATCGDRIVGLWRAQGQGRMWITHLLVDPAWEEDGLAAALLIQGAWLCWTAGAEELGGYLPLGSPLLPLVESMGGEHGVLCRWVSGPLREENLFTARLQVLSQAELLVEIMSELRHQRRRLCNTEDNLH